MRVSGSFGWKVGIAGLDGLEPAYVKGEFDAAVGFFPGRLEIGQKQRAGAERERRRRVEFHMAVLDGNALPPEICPARTTRGEQGFGLTLDELFFDDHSRSHGGKGRAQPLRVALERVFALEGRSFSNGPGIQKVFVEVGGNDAHADLRARLVPGLPSN